MCEREIKLIGTIAIELNLVNMTKRVRKHLSLLKRLRKCTLSAKDRKAVLYQGGKPLQLCLQECAINILKGNVQLSKAQFDKLKRYKKQLRELGKKKTSQSRRIQIEQKGGFLPLMLAPIVGSLLGGLFQKSK